LIGLPDEAVIRDRLSMCDSAGRRSGNHPRRLGPPSNALQIGGVGPVQVGRVREGALSLPLSS